MVDEHGNIWTYRLKWSYLLLLVVSLMSPVFYVIYISFNENGFGAAEYVFTLEWYKLIFSDKLMMNANRIGPNSGPISRADNSVRLSRKLSTTSLLKTVRIVFIRAAARVSQPGLSP